MLMGVHPVVNAPCNAGCESDQDHDLGNVERHGIHPRFRIVRSFLPGGKAMNWAGAGGQSRRACGMWPARAAAATARRPAPRTSRFAPVPPTRRTGYAETG